MSILFFPCALCGVSCKAGHGICDPCQRALPLLPAQRCRCGLPVSPFRTATHLSACRACEQVQPAFDRIYVPYAWAFPLDQLVGDYKYRHRLHLEPVIQQLWGFGLDQLQPPVPDGLVPIPSSPVRLMFRGFNQSARLARLLAQYYQIAVVPCLQRTRTTRRQQQLSASKRHANLRNTLAANADLSGMHLAVVDDVVTTTATASEAARALRHAGASRVDIWALARTLPADYRTHFSGPSGTNPSHTAPPFQVTGG